MNVKRFNSIILAVAFFFLTSSSWAAGGDSKHVGMRAGGVCVLSAVTGGTVAAMVASPVMVTGWGFPTASALVGTAAMASCAVGAMGTYVYYAIKIGSASLTEKLGTHMVFPTDKHFDH